PFALFFAAVLVSAWYGGVRPALLSTALSALATDYYFLSPVYSLHLSPAAAVQLLIFIAVSLFIAVLTRASKPAVEKAFPAHWSLGRATTVAFALAFALLLVIGGVAHFQFRRHDEHSGWVAHNH